jgi:outer membrane protein
MILAGLFLFLGSTASLAGEKMTLQESIDIALKQSLLIHSAREGVAGAQAQEREAFTGFLPKLSTSYGYNRLNEDPTMTVPTLGTFGTGTRDNYTWATEVRQPLFAGGGIVANWRAGKLGAEIARTDEQAAVNDLVLDVKTTYFSVLKAQRIAGAARQAVELLQAHRNMAKDFFDVGMVPRNDVLRAEVELANGTYNLTKAENVLEMAKANFNTILRRDVNEPVALEDIPDLRPFDGSIENMRKQALENRPELRSYAMKTEQADRYVDAARSEFFPTISAVGHYERFGDTPGVSGSPYQDAESWYVGGMLSWNFWEWGRTKYRVDSVKSRRNQVQDALEGMKDRVTLEVKNAWLQLDEARKQVAVTKKAIEQAEENFRMSQERYREQVGTATEVLDAQTLLTRSRSDHAGALADYHIGLARLERAMGRR